MARDARSANAVAGHPGYLPRVLGDLPLLCLIFVPALALAVQVKTDLLRPVRFALATKELEHAFTWWQDLGFYSADLLCGVLVLPALVSLAFGWLSRRWLLVIHCLLALCVVGFSYVQLRALRLTGTFASLDMLRDAVEWAATQPGQWQEYVLSGGISKLLGLSVATVVVTIVVGRLLPRPFYVRRRRAAVIGWFVPLITLTMAVAMPFVQLQPMHRAALRIAFSSFCGLDDPNRGPSPDPADEDGLLRAYADSAAIAPTAPLNAPTTTPTTAPTTPTPGVASGCDVLLFVFETGPVRCLPDPVDFRGLPNIQRLARNAIVAARHHATFPNTDRSVFSLLTSWYPHGIEQVRTVGRAAGLFWALRGRGYRTALYSPIPALSRLEKLYRGIGAERLVLPGADWDVAAEAPDAYYESTLAARIARDENLLQKARHDVLRWISQDQRYAAIILPQVGHAPWEALPGSVACADLYQRGREILALQDRWLGEIVDALAAAGRLHKTLIVVTADHGIRTRVEDPAFVPGRLDAVTFHVPLVLFAPAAWAQSRVLREATSHVDVSPTLLELLGIRDQRHFEQGLPLWDPRLPTRRIFLWADEFFGIDGYHERGRYFAWRDFENQVFWSDHLAAETFIELAPGDGQRQGVIDVLRRMRGVQHALARAALSPR